MILNWWGIPDEDDAITLSKALMLKCRVNTQTLTGDQLRSGPLSSTSEILASLVKSLGQADVCAADRLLAAEHKLVVFSIDTVYELALIECDPAAPVEDLVSQIKQFISEHSSDAEVVELEKLFRLEDPRK